MNWLFWKKVNRKQINTKDLLDDSGRPRFYPLANGELVSYSDDPVQAYIPPAPTIPELTDYQKAARLEYKYFKAMASNKSPDNGLCYRALAMRQDSSLWYSRDLANMLGRQTVVETMARQLASSYRNV